jgi:hypothetical protein
VQPHVHEICGDFVGDRKFPGTVGDHEAATMRAQNAVELFVEVARVPNLERVAIRHVRSGFRQGAAPQSMIVLPRHRLTLA